MIDKSGLHLKTAITFVKVCLFVIDSGITGFAAFCHRMYVMHTAFTVDIM